MKRNAVRREIVAKGRTARLVSLVTALAFVTIITRADQATQVPSGMRVYASQRGGFQVMAPDSWHFKELPSEGPYKAALSREPIGDDGEMYKYGLAIWRARDYRHLLDMKSRKPSEVAAEFA